MIMNVTCNFEKHRNTDVLPYVCNLFITCVIMK